jgi:hypothetical protein
MLPGNSGDLRDDRPLRQVINDGSPNAKAANIAGLRLLLVPSKEVGGAIGTFVTIDSSGSIRKIETFSQVNGNDGSISGRTLVRRRSVSGFKCQGTARSRI